MEVALTQATAAAATKDARITQLEALLGAAEGREEAMRALSYAPSRGALGRRYAEAVKARRSAGELRRCVRGAGCVAA